MTTRKEVITRNIWEDEFDIIFKDAKEVPFTFNQRTIATKGFGKHFRVNMPVEFTKSLRYKARQYGVTLDEIEIRHMPLLFELKGFYANNIWHRVTDLRL